MRGRQLIAAGAAVLGVFVIAPSHADDAKTYPASFCQPIEQFDLDRVEYEVPFADPGQGAANVSDDQVWITCPVVRDTLGNTDGLVKAYLNVSDGSSSDNFDCTLYAISRDGSNVVDSQSKGTSGTGFERLVFDGIDSSGTISTYHFFCKVPEWSELFSYRVIEYDP